MMPSPGSSRRLLALLLLASPLALAAEVHALDAAEWSRPRSAEAVTAMPTVRTAVRTWEQTPAARLVIRHPGGEAGVLWAEELRDWLIATGLPSNALGLRSDNALRGKVELIIERDGSGEAE